MKRCAIYTRKSTDEGLEQDFNSLHAQRDACEAYIKSQKQEGWKLIKTAFDDGGVSGGTMDRPSLNRLLAAIKRREIDIVVVYKVDRLTRSLADFAKMVELFDAHNVSFVSVTQQFNTTTSMGRLTLNVLLSFAQFEREVTAERIRDKFAASKKKGIWMGGPVPIGYDVRERKLVINEDGAAIVRTLYDLYLELGTVKQVKQEADRRDLRTRVKTSKTGRQTGGVPFTRGHLYRILSNPIYVGDMPHKDQVYPGEHEAIITREKFDRVQTQLSGQAIARHSQTNTPSPSLLKGLLYDAAGDALHVIQAAKGSRRYRYYVSSRRVYDPDNNPNGLRLPAEELEALVLEAVAAFLVDHDELEECIGQGVYEQDVQIKLDGMRQALRTGSFAEKFDLVSVLVTRIDIGENDVSITVSIDHLASQVGLSEFEMNEHCIVRPIKVRSQSNERKLILVDDQTSTDEADPALCRLIANTHRWMRELTANNDTTVETIAEREGMKTGDVCRLLPLAFLAPDVIESILDGRQPIELTSRTLRRARPIPENWADQRRFLGFPSII
ncbi:MAG: recombinase family protein [Alphaproteobacteria bacterium]